MLQKRKGGFQHALQKSIFLYALIPLLVLVVLTTVLTHCMLYRITNDDLQANADRAALVMDQTESHYFAALQRLANDADLALALEQGSLSTGLYEKLYAIVNTAPIKGSFFLLDENRSIVGGSVTTVPAYLSKQGLDTGLLWPRLNRSENGIAIASSGEASPSLLLITRVNHGGRTAGYVLFELTQSNALSILLPEGQLMLSDNFRNIVWATDTTLLDSQGRIATMYVGMNGLTQKGDRQLCLVCAKAFNGQLNIYAYADTTIYRTIYRVLWFALGGMFLLLMPLLFLAARNVARRNGQSVNKIARAMQNTNYDTLNQPLEIHTGDEFEKIAESYQQMCQEMRALINNNTEIAKQQVISEMKQLEAQFNPHFLFNTLEAIRVLIKLDPDSASHAIVALAELLRYSINNTIRSVTLMEDMHYTECYLKIQKHRLQEKLDYRVSIAAEARQCMVPKLVVQPLVENAVKYGADESGHYSIDIRARIAENTLRIEVTDSGRVFTPKQAEDIRQMMNTPTNVTAHNGLHNIHKRLRLAYGEDYGIELTPSPDGTGNRFTAVLPIREEETLG